MKILDTRRAHNRYATLALTSAIALLAVFFCPNASAGSLAETSYKLIIGDCPKGSGTRASTEKEKCLSRPELLATDVGEMSELAHLAGLAEERAASLECTAKQIQEVKKTPADEEKIAEDALAKIQIIAAENKKMKDLWPAISGAMNMRASGKFGEPAAPVLGAESLTEELNGKVIPGSAYDQYKKAFNAAKAARSSLLFESLDSHREGVDELVTQVEAMGEVSPAALEKLKARYKGVLQESMKRAYKDMVTMKAGADSGGASLTDQLKESLAQDVDLVEAFHQRNKSIAESLKGPACRVDAKYGRGAKYRDYAIMGVTSVGGFGIAGATKIGTRLVAKSLTGAAATGAMGLRQVSILRWAVVGAELGNGAVSVAEFVKTCGSGQPSIGGNLDASKERSCDTNVIRSLEPINCYFAGAMTALGVTGSGLGIYQAAFAKWGAKAPGAAAKVAASEDGEIPAFQRRNRAPVENSEARAAEPLTQGQADAVSALRNRAERLNARKSLRAGGFDPDQIEMIDSPLGEVQLKVNQVKQDSVANWMKVRSERDGVQYFFDDSKFTDPDVMAMAINGRVYLRSTILKNIDSAENRERIAHETKHATDWIKCQKHGDAANCGSLIRYTAKKGKLKVDNYEDHFYAGEWESSELGHRVVANDAARKTAEQVAKEEAEILTEARELARQKQQPARWLEKRKEAVYNVKLKDGREVEVAVPYSNDSSPEYFEQVLATRLGRKHVNDELLKASGEMPSGRVSPAVKIDMEPKKYAKSYTINARGEVVSKHRPTNLIPFTGKAADPKEVPSAGVLLDSIEAGRAYFKSKDFRDGTHVFLIIRGKDGRDRMMIANRIPSNKKQADEEMYVTHRSLRNRYKELTGEEVNEVPGGGELVASQDRHVHSMVDRMGSFHYPDRYHPTANYSADLISAHGAGVDEHTVVKQFKAWDPSSHEAGHFAAEHAVRVEKEINRDYPQLLGNVRRISERYLSDFDLFTNMENARKVVKMINDRNLPAERRLAYGIIKRSLDLARENSLVASAGLLKQLQTDVKLRRDVPGAVRFVESYMDDYLRDVERALAAP